MLLGEWGTCRLKRGKGTCCLLGEYRSSLLLGERGNREWKVARQWS